MIYPPIGKLTEKTDSRYSLVIATAKRARIISEDPEREVKKPVIEAIQEISNGDVVILSEGDKKETQVVDEVEYEE